MGTVVGGGHLSKEMPPTRSCTIDAFFQKNAGGPHPGNPTPEPTLRTTHPSLSRRIWILTLAFTSFAILGQLLNFSKYQFSFPFRRAKFLSQFYVPPPPPSPPYNFPQNSWVACPFIRGYTHWTGVQEQPGHDINFDLLPLTKELISTVQNGSWLMLDMCVSWLAA